jgi:glyoxylase-like metal-dependent hydrolase (beta-lactamase superfamily II)
MMEEVMEGIYRIEVPLPIPVVGSMNCYVLTDQERSLVVDPGMAHGSCFEAVMAGLDEIGVDLKRMDFFITHHHLDHFGLVSKIMRDGSVIYVARVEAELIEEIASWTVLPILSRFLEVMGFPQKDPEQVVCDLLGEEYRARNPWPFRYLDEGDVIEKGGGRFRTVATPGHSPGHTCLYEPDRGVLIAGDAFLPVLQFLSDTDNPLRGQFNSFDRLDRLDARMVLPGHRSVFTDVKERTERLKAHHRARNESIVAVLADAGMDAYQVATSITWNVPESGDWETLPVTQQFIVVRDCFAHLLYLEAEGRIRKEKKGQKTVYSLV